MTTDTENLTEQRQHAHAYIDRLPGEQLSAVCGLLESMLSPFDRSLALAPWDDEPLTAEEIAATEASEAYFAAGGPGFSMEEILADFGLTTADLERMSETPASPD